VLPGQRTMRARVLALCALALGMIVLGVSCGVTGPRDFQELDPDELAGLLDTTTTPPPTTSTTTSTTIAPSTTAPPATTATTVLDTTTTVQVEPVPMYFIAGSRLTPIVLSLPRPVSAEQVLSSLLAGPPADATGVGLRTALYPDLLVSVDESRGIATVELLQASVDLIPPDQLPLAFGQLVLTLELRGIGAVRFRIGGADIAVPKGDGSITTAGETVTFDDYRSLT
jgi:hypothetical protein